MSVTDLGRRNAELTQGLLTVGQFPQVGLL